MFVIIHMVLTSRYQTLNFAFHMLMARSLRQRSAFNLNVDVLGQRLDSNTAAGGLVSEPLGVLLVHRLASQSKLATLGS